MVSRLRARSSKGLAFESESVGSEPAKARGANVGTRRERRERRCTSCPWGGLGLEKPTDRNQLDAARRDVPLRPRGAQRESFVSLEIARPDQRRPIPACLWATTVPGRGTREIASDPARASSVCEPPVDK